MTEVTCELLVIGGGTGGLRLALMAAREGHETVIADPGVLGGTCLNTGCIPSKTLLHAAELFHEMRRAQEFGLHTSNVSADFAAVMQRMHRIVYEGQEHVKESVNNRKHLRVVKGKAAFVSRNAVQVGQARVKAKRVVIATGARPVVPKISGIEQVKAMVSDDVLELREQPRSLLVIGGGYIALELATFFNALGTEVVVIEHNPRILKEVDEEVTQLLQRLYEKRGVRFLLGREIVRVEKEKAGVKVVVKQGEKGREEHIAGEKLLVATGRAPNSAGLILEKAGVKVNERGGIEVNEFLETSQQGIYAMGDVTGRAPFAHAAKRESYLVLHNAFGRKKEAMPFSLVPWAIFTYPPIAAVGLSEAKAKEQKLKYGMQRAEFARAGRATVMGKTEGFVKVLYEKKTRKILGAVIIGARADDLIHEYVALLTAGATIDTLHRVIHIHPTLSEVNEALSDVED